MRQRVDVLQLHLLANGKTPVNHSHLHLLLTLSDAYLPDLGHVVECRELGLSEETFTEGPS